MTTTFRVGRAECLNAHWFLSLADAREKMEDWRKYYNEERPHGGDRPNAADNAAQSRWRSQPAMVSKAGKSNRRRSKDRPHCKALEKTQQGGPTIGSSSRAASPSAGGGPSLGSRPGHRLAQTSPQSAFSAQNVWLAQRLRPRRENASASAA
jgi:hypothetical protein